MMMMMMTMMNNNNILLSIILLMTKITVLNLTYVAKVMCLIIQSNYQ